MLLAVPNVSVGEAGDRLDELIAATAPARLLNLHTDPDHGRTVLTLAAPQGEIAGVLASLAAAAARLIDVTSHPGIHPHVGALDVAPVVYLDDVDRGAAVAEALTAGMLIGDLGVPVVLYGQLATRPEHVERADVRRGGPRGLAERLTADYGPVHSLHPTAGATLVTARPPLLAFNVDLDTSDVELAKSIAAGMRESGGGFPGVRAIGLYLPARGRAQVSLNVHDHRAAPLRDLVAHIGERAPIAEAELVGVAPRAAFDGFPADIPLRDFDSSLHLIENALRSSD
jgi:glutamate formiminotransferase / 5-formyltetrahydrofolate cyclo-ligase